MPLPTLARRAKLGRGTLLFTRDLGSKTVARDEFRTFGWLPCRTPAVKRSVLLTAAWTSHARRTGEMRSESKRHFMSLARQAQAPVHRK
jgi:hypothetical protein